MKIIKVEQIHHQAPIMRDSKSYLRESLGMAIWAILKIFFVEGHYEQAGAGYFLV
jgi:hypothetical protein